MTEKRERYVPWWAEDMEKKRRNKSEKNVKRGKHAKKKGNRGESELGKHTVKRIGGKAIVRHGNRDVQFTDNALSEHHVEVKRHARFAMEKHCKQAEEDAALHGLPRWVVPWRPDGQARWRFSGDYDDYLDDMNELRDLRTIVDGLAFAKEVEDEDAER